MPCPCSRHRICARLSLSEFGLCCSLERMQGCCFAKCGDVLCKACAHWSRWISLAGSGERPSSEGTRRGSSSARHQLSEADAEHVNAPSWPWPCPTPDTGCKGLRAFPEGTVGSSHWPVFVVPAGAGSRVHPGAQEVETKWGPGSVPRSSAGTRLLPLGMKLVGRTQRPLSTPLGPPRGPQTMHLFRA